VAFWDSTKSILNGGRAVQSDVREAALKQHLKFDAVGAHYAGTIQDAAFQLEMADAILVDQLSDVFQRFVLRKLCDLRFLLRGHRLYELSEIPMHLCIKFLGVEWNKYIELDPFRPRVGSEPATSAANDVYFRGY
jgi:hypothetical protein